MTPPLQPVLLVRPDGIGKKEFPVGLLYVGTALRRAGHLVRIIDLMDTPDQETEIADLLAAAPGTVLGISALAPHYLWVKTFTLALKQRLPDLKIVVGGHVAALFDRLLTRTGVDYVCRGKGELFFPELLRRLREGETLRSLGGLACLEAGQVVNTGRKAPEPPPMLPDYDLIALDRYLIHPSRDFFFRNDPDYQARARADDRLAVIMFSRGCTDACSFCYRHIPGFSQNSVDHCLAHMRLLMDNHGVRYFRIDDELFTNDHVWFETFCRQVEASGLEIGFRITGIRPGMVNAAQLARLKEIGCIAVNFGIESGSQEILDGMIKRTTIADNLLSLSATRAAGMQTMGYFIFGFPGENVQTLQETIGMVLDSDLAAAYVSVFYAVALPGTKLYRDAVRQGLIVDEEAFLDSLYCYINEDRPAWAYYEINLASVPVAVIRKWELALFLLLALHRRWPLTGARREALFRLIDRLPSNGAGRAVIKWTTRLLR